jgi:hypothetical protein
MEVPGSDDDDDEKSWADVPLVVAGAVLGEFGVASAGPGESRVRGAMSLVNPGGPGYVPSERVPLVDDSSGTGCREHGVGGALVRARGLRSRLRR